MSRTAKDVAVLIVERVTERMRNGEAPLATLWNEEIEKACLVWEAEVKLEIRRQMTPPPVKRKSR